MANSMDADPALRQHVRVAKLSDASAIHKLLQMGVYVHIHVDWRPPGDWLGLPGFVVYEEGKEDRAGDGRRRDSLTACMAITADPPPAAWVRVAAAKSTASFAIAEAMFAQILENLDPAIEDISWFLADYWPLHWLERLGFRYSIDVIAFRKEDLAIPPFKMPPELYLRPLMFEDIPALVEIEAAAFEPRWRHSASDLELAWRNSLSFDVALLDEKPVAYQVSTGGEGNAHLARMTVHPDHQGRGIGAALLATAISKYRLQNIRTVTLNTQSDNEASHHLYERFGFRPTGRSYPVWTYSIDRARPV
ncbi:MAG: GNAT family N-acetyltransferase [Anaerolineae bacterium]|nr:GNAT family N-acetyltransferase [Promineifilum sp.]MCZ2113755.1 GNAT family N-acetyltransferase [Anaerolineae bacterium]